MIVAYEIDVCPTDANLVAISAGGENAAKIFDRRESKIVKEIKDSGKKSIVFMWSYYLT